MIRETVDVRQLAERLSELLLVVADGNEVMLVQGEKPVARLLPPEQTIAERVPGLHRGEIWMSDDFDAPLPDSFWSEQSRFCLLYTSPSPRDRTRSRMPSSA